MRILNNLNYAGLCLAPSCLHLRDSCDYYFIIIIIIITAAEKKQDINKVTNKTSSEGGEISAVANEESDSDTETITEEGIPTRDDLIEKLKSLAVTKKTDGFNSDLDEDNFSDDSSDSTDNDDDELESSDCDEIAKKK